MTIWTALMVLAGGLFAGGVVTIAWSHSPAWRTMPAAPFVTDFRRTIRTADKVQPALLVVSIATAIAVAIGSEGTARTAAAVGAAGFVAILIASVALLVPLQQRIIGCPPEDADAIASMRSRWIRGHLGRSVLALASFLAVVTATIL